MGRGVETIGPNVLYFDANFETDDVDQCSDDENSFIWEDLIENLREALSSAFSSLKEYHGGAEYPYREQAGILENYHVKIYISEYCGCGAISVTTWDSEYPELADSWVIQVWKKMTKIIGEHVDLLTKLGTMSNGVSVFEKRK